MWAAPRLANDVQEFKTISDQLTIKYGKPFAEAARANQLEFPAKVAPKLISKLGIAAPPKIMVERYMIEIAASAGVPFMPDPDVMRDDEVAQAEKMLIDYKQAGTSTNITDVTQTEAFHPLPPPKDGVNYGWIPPSAAPGDDYGGSGSGIHIYEVPRNAPTSYDSGTGPNAGAGYITPPTGTIQLPKIAPNGLPIYPGSESHPYPTLSQRDQLAREQELFEKLDDLCRDIEELKKQQLLKAPESRNSTILSSAVSAICQCDVAVLMFLILMFCAATTSAQYLPSGDKKIVACGCDMTVSWQDAVLNTIFLLIGILANQLIKLRQDKVKLKKVIKEKKEKEDQTKETGTGCAIGARSVPSNDGYPCTCPGCLLGHNIWATAGVIPPFAGALLAPIAHPVPSAPPPS